MILSIIYRRHNAAVWYWFRLTATPIRPDVGRRLTPQGKRLYPRRLGCESKGVSACIGTYCFARFYEDVRFGLQQMLIIPRRSYFIPVSTPYIIARFIALYRETHPR